LSQVGARAEILRKISDKIGFPFKEEELSPKLRKLIGALAQRQFHLYNLYMKKGSQEQSISTLRSYTISLLFLGFLFLLLGLLMLVNRVFEAFGVTVFFSSSFLLGGFFIYWRYYQVENKKLSETKTDISVFSSKLEEDISTFSNTVYNELSEVHEARVRPMVRHVTVNFAEIIQAAKGRGIILNTIECPHCAAPVSLPKSGESFTCEHCGKVIHAINVFEMLRDILKQT